jgi:hypothetical protein
MRFNATLRTRSTGHAPRVHKAPIGFAYAPMPKPLSGTVNRVLQGGYPPVPYRSRNDWSDANRSAGEPSSCKQIHMEVVSARKDNQ